MMIRIEPAEIEKAVRELAVSRFRDEARVVKLDFVRVSTKQGGGVYANVEVSFDGEPKKTGEKT